MWTFVAVAQAGDERGDCEAVPGSWLEQDVNAWSSFGYVAVGLVLLAAVLRRRMAPHVAALGVLAALAGIGSVLFHGRSSDISSFLHDVSFLGVLGYVAGFHVGRIRGRAPTGALLGTAATVLVGGSLWAVTSSVTSPLAGGLVLVTVGAELVARHRGQEAIWRRGLAVFAGLSGVMWLLGRSDSPLCEPGSWRQPHALWHLLGALVLVVWADRAEGVVQPVPPRLLRHGVDRVGALLARVLTYAFYRSVEVVGLEGLPPGRPTLIVANHANGFVDPILVAAVLGRLPRFIAKAALWKVAPARPLLALAGVLPVYRVSDGDRPGDNVSTFAATHRELATGATVAIFPEGSTGDRGGLDRVRTGAARMALGALPDAPGLQIVPIGMAFESRIEMRARAVVMMGRPIHAADHDDVAELTAAITDALESVSPDYDTVEERELLRAAARVTQRMQMDREPTFAAVETMARRLASCSTPARELVMDRYRRYATSLHSIGLRDRDVRPRHLPWIRIAGAVLLLAFFGPFFVAVTLVHAPALVLVLGATGWVRSTATKGTVRLLVGLVAGLSTWVVAGFVLADGPMTFVAAVTVAASGGVALAIWSPLTHSVLELIGLVRRRDRAGLLPAVIAAQEQVVQAVTAAIADVELVRPDEGGGRA